MKRLIIAVIAGFVGIMLTVWIVAESVDPVMIEAPHESVESGDR